MFSYTILRSLPGSASRLKVVSCASHYESFLEGRDGSRAALARTWPNRRDHDLTREPKPKARELLAALERGDWILQHGR